MTSELDTRHLELGAKASTFRKHLHLSTHHLFLHTLPNTKNTFKKTEILHQVTNATPRNLSHQQDTVPPTMPRGNEAQCKVHYKGKSDDFIIFVDSAQAVQDWKKDKTVALATVVSGWKVFVTHKHGSHGILDGASKGQLEGEFGTSKDDDVFKQIIENGSIVESEEHGRQGDKNVSQGPRMGH
ncbi:hypothetical protein D0867_05699 [Hortaea werneckii]|uniref:Ribosome maturation protein SDO1/SBDS N-terminal domain-containing protein n=1 Tax=Hortaea werneckii TaxID=91943 RepID=A0A3M7APT9_HORWE|nr:hypothetical protein D0867_05699 [Hortaea werneckii]RMY29339.1 hypothetical protein D0866_08765 [Hortaea werneckii]